jgi:hypothetical protein
MATKLILILSILLFCFCSIEEKVDKNAKAKKLYIRISQVIYNTIPGNANASDFTTEWKNIFCNIIENKDTLFMSYNNDFQILITKKVHIESIKDPTQNCPAKPHNSW